VWPTIPVRPVTNIPTVIVQLPSPPVITYEMSDFGENAINNHYVDDGWHSERCQMIFDYVTKDYRDRCTCYQSYKTPLLGNNIIFNHNYLSKCSLVKADIMFKPYVNSAYSSAGEYNNFILVVGSHRENNGTDGNLYDDERHDLTEDANTFLEDSIAVSARRDIPSEFTGSTSYGYGMEFFEDCSPEGLNGDYPDRDILDAFAEIICTDGVNIISNVHPVFATRLSVGEEIVIKHTPNSSSWQTTTVTEIVAGNHIRVSPEIATVNNQGIYGWKYVTLGETMYGQAQSWAVPLVAGKLKVIKMATNSDWETVRAAARATAKRNLTGIAEIDEANWDIYRGFGSIQIEDAIEFINNLS
jgi:hypothetical protein